MMIETNWRTTFIDYIKDQVLPLGIKKDVAEAVRIMRRSKNYVLFDNKFYKRGAGSEILMRQSKRRKKESYKKLMKAHAETTQPHARWSAKSLDQDSTGPQHYQTQNYSSNDVQGASTLPNKSHWPAHNLITIPPSWPFACWSLEMIGPLLTAPGGFTLLSVKTHRRVATGNTKSREVAGALACTAPSSTARNLAHAFAFRDAGRAT